MTLTPLQETLLLFLDPAGRYPKSAWRFVDPARPGTGVGDGGLVLCFSRRELPRYLLARLRALFRPGEVRTVLHIDDGLLSSMFELGNGAAYRAFALRHLPRPATLRRKLRSLLPLWSRSETAFLVTLPPGGSERSSADDGVEAADFLFFSNLRGKLLLTRGEVLQSGRGELFKTSIDPEYLPAMDKEFAIVEELSRKLGPESSLPPTGRRLTAGGRLFFSESYIAGRNLCNVLEDLARQGDVEAICRIMDRLDGWYDRFRERCAKERAPLSALYAHLLPLFAASFGAAASELLDAGVQALERVASCRPALAAVPAHNDLWPGNIVVTAQDLVVIDWERATERRAPFFDYFWLVISTALEPLGRLASGGHDYGAGFRRFLDCSDPISRHARMLLHRFLERLGVDRELFPELMFLFLMEWSVQGFQTLHRQTDMDRLAFRELCRFRDRHHAFEPVLPRAIND